MSIGVVIPNYDDERRLRWVLNALVGQTYPHHLVHVVVADDGSPRTPALPDLPFRCEVVRQDDLGFRAAAARNLGATAASGELLVFLDGDTIPTPGFLAAMAGAFDDIGPGMLAVGKRLHADFTGCTDQEVGSWVQGGVPEGHRLPAPAWLSDSYARTCDLREAGEEDFRFVISAVLAVDRRLFERAGGFDATIVGYGGEDWDLAWRCWLLGAQLRHVPAALAWHDGPDAASRDGNRSTSRETKDIETLSLAQRITLPSARGRGLIWAQPDVVISMHGAVTDVQVCLTAMSVLRDSDAGLWLVDRADVPPALAADPRVHAGAAPRSVQDRARFQVQLAVPVRLDISLTQACEANEMEVPGVLRIRQTRRLALDEADPEPSERPPWLHELPDDGSRGHGLEQMLGRWDRDG